MVLPAQVQKSDGRPAAIDTGLRPLAGNLQRCRETLNYTLNYRVFVQRELCGQVRPGRSPRAGPAGQVTSRCSSQQLFQQRLNGQLSIAGAQALAGEDGPQFVQGKVEVSIYYQVITFNIM